MKNVYGNKGDIYMSIFYLVATALTVAQTFLIVWFTYTLNSRTQASVIITSNTNEILDRIIALETQFRARNQILRDIRNDIRSKSNM